MSGCLYNVDMKHSRKIMAFLQTNKKDEDEGKKSMGSDQAARHKRKHQDHFETKERGDYQRK